MRLAGTAASLHLGYIAQQCQHHAECEFCHGLIGIAGGVGDLDTLGPGLLAVHPYEEPAFDLYPLQNSWQQAGAGVIGELETPETELEFLKRIKKTFEVGCLKHNKLTGREIQTVALCGGAGAFLMPLAIRNRADVFITGEIKYHDYFGHDTDILLAEIGHYESEQYTKEIFYTIIRDLFPNVEVQQSKINTNPIKYM